MSDRVFERIDPALGELAVRPVGDGDADLLARWFRHPKSRFWMAQDATPESVRAEFRAAAADPYIDAYMGLHRGAPRFLIEVYDPEHSELAGRFEHEVGDIGMHVLNAPTDTPVHGFTRAVMRFTMDYLFEERGATRVVVEPDVENTPIHKLNSWAGFTADRTVPLTGKEALLSFCTREAYASSAAKGAAQ
ncbi:GNAT family N-acetyltransferase [Salininema proteolyticum]|uniref:Lysine N-acyltransferase MbtK n=1 Tax=Salininema proteolyticum TaxID=1607685 RepID=A0ABV8U4L3_9ACTN